MNKPGQGDVPNFPGGQSAQAPSLNNHAHGNAIRDLQVLNVQTPPYPLQRAVRPQSLLSRATNHRFGACDRLIGHSGRLDSHCGRPKRSAKDTYDVARDYHEVAMRTDGYVWMTTRHVKVDSDAHVAVKRWKRSGASN